MGPSLDHPAVVEDDDLVGVPHGREPVGDGDRGATPGQGVEGLLDGTLGLGVECAGRLVEHQDPRVAEQGAGDGEPLLLPAGEAMTT